MLAGYFVSTFGTDEASRLLTTAAVAKVFTMVPAEVLI